MMYGRFFSVAVLAFGLNSNVAQAAEPAPGQNLAAPCAICHGTDGRSVGGVDRLAGMSRSDMVRKLGEYKSGARPATVMHQISKGYSDREIALLADFFAAQKK